MKQADIDFILRIHKELSSAKPVQFKGKRAKQEARKIMSTIPTLMRNYLVWEQSFQWTPVRLGVYAFYGHELKTGEELFNPKAEQSYTQFKTGSVGYYLCKYLYDLGFIFSVWCGTVNILMDYPRNTSIMQKYELL